MSAIPRHIETFKEAPAIIEFVEMEHCYGGSVKAVKPLTLSLPRDGMVALMGPSGSGKTTLLGCISGRIAPCGGRVIRRGTVATIHQDLRLVEQRTALENVLHGAMRRHGLWPSLWGFPRREREKAADLLCRVGLADKLHQTVKSLSGGERQRVAIARALMQDPEILLADEPVASLDEDSAHAIMRLIRELAAERKLTVVAALHDYSIANEYCDRIVRLVDGRLVYNRAAETPAAPEHAGVIRADYRDPSELEFVSFRKASSDEVKVLSQSPGWSISTRRKIFFAVAALLYIAAIAGLDISARQLSEAGDGFLAFLGALLPQSFSEISAMPWESLLAALLETLQMALIGTTCGIIISWPLAALAAKNVGPDWLRPGVRFMLNAVRTIPSIIWALLFVAAVGLGPLAGILALSAYSVGYLTKFFYEGIEAVNPGPQNALGEIGASKLQQFVHAVWPAAKPAIFSSSLFMLEYNVRHATVLGVVDAGGIGFYIKQYLDFRAFPVVVTCLAMMLIIVVVIDTASTWLRAKLVQ